MQTATRLSMRFPDPAGQRDVGGQRNAGRVSMLVCCMFGFATLAFVANTAEVNDDFLEYLGNLESNDDNWTDFAGEAAAESSGPRANVSTNESTASSLNSSRQVKSTDVVVPRSTAAPSIAPKASK